MKSQIEVHDDGITITRVFDAEIQRVFDAWTKPELVSQWWGCAMTTAVKSTIDLRVGGEYRHLMTMEGHGEFDALGVITELDIPNLLVYEIEMGPMEGMPPMPKNRIQVEFTAHGEQTEVKLSHRGIQIDMIKGEVQKGWGAAFEKLSARLEEATA